MEKVFLHRLQSSYTQMMKCAKFSRGSDGDQWSSILATSGARSGYLWIFLILRNFQLVTRRFSPKWRPQRPQGSNRHVESNPGVSRNIFHTDHDSLRCIFHDVGKPEFYRKSKILLHFEGKMLGRKNPGLFARWKKISKCVRIAAIHPISMGSKYDRAESHNFRTHKKIWIWRPVELQFEHNRHKSPKKPRNLRVLGFLHNISYLFAEFTLPRLWKSFLES